MGGRNVTNYGFAAAGAIYALALHNNSGNESEVKLRAELSFGP